MIIKGQKISDRYLIVRSIGEGGMANVYLAHDTILDRDVAIKVLRGDLSNDEKFVRRFQREALAASSLSHPNIVEMYDVGEDNGIYYIVMEYVEGKTVKQLVKKRGSLTLSEALDIMLQLTDGISHAHDSYIIHRDLKPQNILIKDDGQIKITDFGIAMALNSTQLTQTNSVMGSVHYLPPEQALGKGATIRSDIYSMGILFYELLTGKLPFKGENAVEIAMKQIKEPLPSVRKQNEAIPQSIENIILKATAKNPKNRYHDAKEMHEDLLTALDEDRLNEPKITYKYPEHEEDIKSNNDTPVKQTKKESKKQPEKKEVKKEEKENTEEIAKKVQDEPPVEEPPKKSSKSTKVVVALAILFSLIVIGIASIFLIIPELTKVPDIVVPNVANMSVIDAENELKDAGFAVATSTVKEENADVDKGLVIRTDPEAGRKIKKGTTITIVESTGKTVLTVEDYTGKNYIEIKTLLESMYQIKVNIEKRDIEDNASEYEEQEIIGQSVAAGETLSEGDSITLYIPNIIDGYPDFVTEGWTVDDVKNFCNQYNITLTIDYQETSDYASGTILSQSRSSDTPIVSGTTLKITVATEPTDSGKPADDEEEDNTSDTEKDSKDDNNTQ